MSGGALDPSWIWACARSVGFSAEQATMITAIVGAESDFRPDVLNDNPKTGDLSYGLAQVNMIGRLGIERRRQFRLANNDELFDPAVNLRAALAISNGGRDWRPWSTYKRGAHVAHLATAHRAAEAIGEDWAAVIATPPTAGDLVARVGSAAIAWMLKEHQAPSDDWTNYCLRGVRMALGVPALYRSASVAWAHTTKRHGTDSMPPPGVPVWWTNGYGHVVLSAGGWYCWSNDILRRGKIDKVHINTITRQWGKVYRGWTEDINGVTVYKAPPKPDPIVVVDLSKVVAAFKADPGRAQGRGLHESHVLPVELALKAEGLLDDRWSRDGAAGTRTIAAYSRWQKRCGYSGDAANGIPGRDSLTRLGARHGFRLVA